MGRGHTKWDQWQLLQTGGHGSKCTAPSHYRRSLLQHHQDSPTTPHLWPPSRPHRIQQQPIDSSTTIKTKSNNREPVYQSTLKSSTGSHHEKREEKIITTLVLVPLPLFHSSFAFLPVALNEVRHQSPDSMTTLSLFSTLFCLMRVGNSLKNLVNSLQLKTL